eukprot:Polyplicarium_translucidae@DN2837_c0_g1_i5.p2
MAPPRSQSAAPRSRSVLQRFRDLALQGPDRGLDFANEAFESRGFAASSPPRDVTCSCGDTTGLHQSPQWTTDGGGGRMTATPVHFASRDGTTAVGHHSKTARSMEPPSRYDTATDNFTNCMIP